MSLVVLEPGLETRIVDLGRPGTRSLGVPVGGAADRRSLMLGNALLGNADDAPTLEIALKGPHLRADADVGCAIFGATIELHWPGSWGPNEIRDQTFTIPAGVDVELGGIRYGARTYLCVRGGFQCPIVLGSQSGLAPVGKGDVLRCTSSRIHARYCPDLISQFPHIREIAVLPGMQASWFDETEFFRQTYAVSAASNRMGLRLNGNPLTIPKREMTSEAVCPGSIQVTNDGQCIVLGVDGQTIGGYPKIAQVIQADLDTLGQLRPGQAIAFKKVTLEEAIECDRRAQADLRQWTMRLRLSLDAIGLTRK